tara:strand:- start:951 stop:1901 length:951 start_codon:yes stop_codon:yes gene_type:complete
MADSDAFGARVMGQWNARDASYHGSIAEANPKTKAYWLDAVQNEDGDNEDWVPPGSIDPVREVTESVFAATEANPDMLQLLAPFTRTEPGPLLQAARARAKAEGWWPLGPAQTSTQVSGNKQRAAHECMSGVRPAAEAMVLPDDPELPGWTIVQHHNLQRNRKWKTFQGPNGQAQVKSRTAALQVQQSADPRAIRKKTHTAKKTHAAVKIVCRRCGGDTEKGNELLQCDTPGCGASHHMWCLEPPLARVPKGDWFCPDCDPHEPDMPPPQPQRQPMLRQEPGPLLRAARSPNNDRELAPACRRWWDQIAEAAGAVA